MPAIVNLADPDVEPTDDELAQLTREAFAGVALANANSLRELNARIVEERAAALRRVAELLKRP